MTKFRPMVLAIGQDHQAKRGVAIARSGPAIFGITPVLDPGGSYIGSFEIGLDFGSILDGLKAAYGLEMALFIEEAPLRQFALGVGDDIYVDDNRIGKYVKFHSTNRTLLKQLVTSADLAADPDGVIYNRSAQGTPFGVLLLPVRNSGGVSLGAIAIARDFSGTRAEIGRSRVWLVATSIIGFVVLTGLVLVVLRGFLLRPLSVIEQHFGALAGGDTAAAIPDSDQLCDELQALAHHHDALRKKASGGEQA